MRKKIHWIHQWVPNLWPDAYMELIINLVSDSYKYLSFKCPARTLDFLNPNLCHPLTLHPSKWNPHLSSFSNNNWGTNSAPGTPNIIHHHLSCPEYVPKPITFESSTHRQLALATLPQGHSSKPLTGLPLSTLVTSPLRNISENVLLTLQYLPISPRIRFIFHPHLQCSTHHIAPSSPSQCPLCPLRPLAMLVNSLRLHHSQTPASQAWLTIPSAQEMGLGQLFPLALLWAVLTPCGQGGSSWPASSTPKGSGTPVGIIPPSVNWAAFIRWQHTFAPQGEGISQSINVPLASCLWYAKGVPQLSVEKDSRLHLIQVRI